jgi:hypothetical protein
MEGPMNRCCKDTLTHYGPRNPIEGLELGCRWCECFLRYESIGPHLMGWTVHDRVGDFITREANPIATEAREKAYQRILGRERAR